MDGYSASPHQKKDLTWLGKHSETAKQEIVAFAEGYARKGDYEGKEKKTSKDIWTKAFVWYLRAFGYVTLIFVMYYLLTRTGGSAGESWFEIKSSK